MAHSNRKKLKASRGGLTRNQLRKQQNSGSSSAQSTRLQETIKWIEQNEEKRRIKVSTSGVKTEAKVTSYSKNVKANKRRKNALKRLDNQLNVLKAKQPKGTILTMDMIPLTEQDTKRIQKELSILKSRVY